MSNLLAEGWYLMSTQALEALLSRRREGGTERVEGVLRLSTEEALSYRNAGNVPDRHGRTLRLVLHVTQREDIARLDEKRLVFEPDFHDAPEWRREGSKPINVVPLRTARIDPLPEDPGGRAWWEDPELRELERAWQDTGVVDGIRIPEAYRSFVYKTVLSLRKSRRDITVAAVTDSLRRWLAEADVREIERALLAANPEEEL